MKKSRNSPNELRRRLSVSKSLEGLKFLKIRAQKGHLDGRAVPVETRNTHSETERELWPAGGARGASLKIYQLTYLFTFYF